MANRIPRVPVREQDPKVRATNFEEVCYGYNDEEAALEASRCLNCKNPKCVASCPVQINIPEFIHHMRRLPLFMPTARFRVCAGVCVRRRASVKVRVCSA